VHTAKKDYEMRKGFTRKPQADEPATLVKNYITRSGTGGPHNAVFVVWGISDFDSITLTHSSQQRA
jgi:hypothetical protein